MAVPAVKARSDAGFFRLSGISAQQPAGKSWSPLPTSGSGMQRRLYQPFLLLILFFLAFALPVAVAARIGGVFKQEHIADPAADELFPESIVVGAGDQKIEIASGQILGPEAGKDFLLVAWFKFRKLPGPDEREVLISKTESGAHSKSGFALAVAGEDGGIRPMVFWGSADGGHWYKFTDLKVPTREWVMIAVSLRDERYLGMNVAEVTEPGKANLQLLGGYDVEDGVIVPNDLPLTVAPAGPARFSGRVGPVGIFRLHGLTENLHELLKKLSRKPLDSMDAFAKKEVALWWPGGDKDLGPQAHKVTVVGVQKGKKVADAEERKRE